mgnify:CR=1 FL=1
MGEEIKVVIEKDGKLILEVHGAGGPQCLTVTESFEKEMGEVLDRRRTNDFYRKAQIALMGKTFNPLRSS